MQSAFNPFCVLLFVSDSGFLYFYSCILVLIRTQNTCIFYSLVFLSICLCFGFWIFVFLFVCIRVHSWQKTYVIPTYPLTGENSRLVVRPSRLAKARAATSMIFSATTGSLVRSN